MTITPSEQAGIQREKGVRRALAKDKDAHHAAVIEQHRGTPVAEIALMARIRCDCGALSVSDHLSGARSAHHMHVQAMLRLTDANPPPTPGEPGMTTATYTVRIVETSEYFHQVTLPDALTDEAVRTEHVENIWTEVEEWDKYPSLIARTVEIQEEPRDH